MSYERWEWKGDLLIPDRKIIEPKASMMVNPFRFGSTPVNSNVAMAISATTTITLPTHASGDYLVMFAYRDGFNTAPTVPAGWTALSPTGLVGANTNSAVLAYKVAASSSETSGTWTNATGLVAATVKQAGSGPLGLGNDSDVTYGNATGNTVTHTGFTLSDTNGKSVILLFGGQRDTTGSFANGVPSGFTSGAAGAGSACIVGGMYSTTGVASFSTTNQNIGGSGTSGYATSALEITGAA